MKVKNEVSEAIDRALEKSSRRMSKKEFEKYKKLALEYYKNNFPEHLKLIAGNKVLGKKEILKEIENESEIGKIIIGGIRFKEILDKELGGFR